MGEFNNILGRDFIIGHLLPALLFLIASSFCFSIAGSPQGWLQFELDEPLKDGAFLLLLGFGLGVLLQAVNRELFRILEGYWPKRLRKPLSQYQVNQFQKLDGVVKRLLREREKHTRERPQEPFPDRERLRDCSRRLAMAFPSRPDLVLPTTFGNTVRAYEDYPRIMYGFESIGGWSRVQAIMPKEALDLIGESRSRVDLWVNLFFLSLSLAVEGLILAFHSGNAVVLWFTLGGAIACAASYWRARSSAERYGDKVKAAYDLFLGDLAQKLGFRLSHHTERNRTFWKAFSRAIVHRQPNGIDEMSKAGLNRANASEETEPTESNNRSYGE